jgi:hypothetical protein
VQYIWIPSTPIEAALTTASFVGMRKESRITPIGKLYISFSFSQLKFNNIIIQILQTKLQSSTSPHTYLVQSVYLRKINKGGKVRL